MKKQFIAKLLVLALVLSMVPVTILAASAGSNDGYYYVSADTTVVSSTTTVDPGDVTVEGGEAVIEATVVGGAAKVVLPEKTVEALAEQATAGEELVLTIEAPGATKLDLSLSAKSLTALGETTGSDLTVKLGDVASISIPNDALTSVFGTSGTAKISAQNSGTSIGFSIQVSGKALKGIKGLQVTF